MKIKITSTTTTTFTILQKGQPSYFTDYVQKFSSVRTLHVHLSVLWASVYIFRALLQYQFTWLICVVYFYFIKQDSTCRLDFPGGTDGKESAGDRQWQWVWSLGQEDPLKDGTATQSSILAWRIPWTKDPWGLPVYSITKSQTLKQLSMHTCTSRFQASQGPKSQLSSHHYVLPVSSTEINKIHNEQWMDGWAVILSKSSAKPILFIQWLPLDSFTFSIWIHTLMIKASKHLLCPIFCIIDFNLYHRLKNDPLTNNHNL